MMIDSRAVQFGLFWKKQDGTGVARVKEATLKGTSPQKIVHESGYNGTVISVSKPKTVKTAAGNAQTYQDIYIDLTKPCGKPKS